MAHYLGLAISAAKSRGLIEAARTLLVLVWHEPISAAKSRGLIEAWYRDGYGNLQFNGISAAKSRGLIEAYALRR